MFRFSFLLAIGMSAYWMILSGYFKPLLLSLGALSVLIVVGLINRMKIADEETVPYLHSIKMMSYFTWLFREIAKANMDVIKAVLAPSIDVTPGMLTIKAAHKTDIGKTVFANSITLTPGTVSVAAMGDDIIVHALLSNHVSKSDFDIMAEQSAWSVSDRLQPEEEV